MSLITEEIGPPRTEQDWQRPHLVPDKPSECDYGFVSEGMVICCSKEELIDHVAEHGVSNIQFVWTPDTPQPVFPEKAPILLDLFKKGAAKGALWGMLAGLGLVGFGLLLAYFLEDWHFLFANLFSIFGAFCLIEGSWELYRSRHYTLDDADSDASSERFARWIKTKPLSPYTISLAASIITVGVFQIIAGDKNSINAAGLVKPAVRNGEVWRAFTCTLMHVNYYHFWMNFGTLTWSSRIFEQTLHRAYIPVVFIISSICGSAFSVVLYPNTTSVGASGGLMGMFGFMTLGAYFYHERYPKKYVRRMIEAIIFTGVLGLVGFAVIDNAAHLGGLCAGLFLGWVALRSGNEERREVNSFALTTAGTIAAGLIWLIALVAIQKMLTAP